MLARYHTAAFVAARLGFRHHAANLVAAGTCARFADIFRAADFFGVALWYPNTLAACARWTLAADFAARTWAVNTLASARIPFPCSRLAYTTCVGATRNLIAFSLPMSTANLDSFGIGNRLTYVIGYVARSGFPDRLANGVVPLFGFPYGFVSRVRYFSCASFPDGFAHGIGSLLGFPNGLANGIGPLLGFPDRLADGVANLASFGFPNRLAYRVGSLTGFPDRLADGIANIASFGFPNRLAYRVGSLLGFPNRLADGVTNFFLALFTYIARDVDNPVFADPVVDSSATLDTLTVPFHATHCFHHSMALSLMAAGCAAVVPCGSAVSGPCYRRQHC